jgi:hypothetical protein
MMECCGSEPISVDQSNQNSVAKNLGEKPVFNALTVQRRFAGERKLRETEAVAEAQPIPLVMDAAKVAIDDMSLVDERVFFIESEELLCDIDIGVGLSGDLSEQIQSAAELLIEDRSRQVVAAFRIASQKEPAAKLLIRLVNRNVRTGHVSVPDE